MLDPLVVHVLAVDAHHEVFEPVGDRPAGGDTGLDADAPWDAAIGDDLVGQCGQFLEGGRDLVALVGERLRAVPHQGLDVGSGGNAVDLAIDRCEFGQPATLSAVTAAADVVGEREELTLLMRSRKPPGCGKSMTSGGLPPSTRTMTSVSNWSVPS